jgi:hypothetical protein
VTQRGEGRVKKGGGRKEEWQYGISAVVYILGVLANRGREEEGGGRREKGGGRREGGGHLPPTYPPTSLYLLCLGREKVFFVIFFWPPKFYSRKLSSSSLGVFSKIFT